jgi:predicted DNA-binding transcriptional regulator AlpA
METQQHRRIIRGPVVCERTGKTRLAIRLAVRSGTFPAPVQLGPRVVGWFEDEIDIWLATLPRRTYGSGRIPFAHRLSCTIDQACQATGIRKSKLDDEIAAGRLRTITIGGRRLVIVPSLLQLLAPSTLAPSAPETR